jgi:hypothetical protein
MVIDDEIDFLVNNLDFILEPDTVHLYFFLLVTFLY